MNEGKNDFKISEKAWGGAVAEWVRALDWRLGDPGFESCCGNFTSELWQFRLPRFASVFRRRHLSCRFLLSGVYDSHVLVVLVISPSGFREDLHGHNINVFIVFS